MQELYAQQFSRLRSVLFNYLENRTRTLYTTYTPCTTFPTLFTCNNLIPKKSLEIEV